MVKAAKRMVIYAKDIEIITGKKPRTAYAILKRIREYYNKTPYELVTIPEFCYYMKMDEETVREGIVN